MFIHFFCLCPLGLATKLNFIYRKKPISYNCFEAMNHYRIHQNEAMTLFVVVAAFWGDSVMTRACKTSLSFYGQML